MTSQNKKNKARNSYFHNGAEKTTNKMKKSFYYNKKLRNKIKSEVRSEPNEMP